MGGKKDMGKRGCKVEGCEGRYYAKGFCVKHYHKNRLQQKEKDAKASSLKTATITERVCQVPGCQKKYFAKGFCVTHYQKNRLLTMKNTAKKGKSHAEKGGNVSGSSTGIVREIDSLGRIVLPMELRRVLDIEVGDSLEIFVDQDTIIFRKYSPGCVFCGDIMRDKVYFKEKIVCKECFTSCISIG